MLVTSEAGQSWGRAISSMHWSATGGAKEVPTTVCPERRRGGWVSPVSRSRRSRVEIAAMTNQATGIAEGWQPFIHNSNEDPVIVISDPKPSAERPR